MFSFDDSISSRALGHPVVAVDVSATPIYDALEAEWRRMFRAVPHERTNEDYTPTQPTYGCTTQARGHAFTQDSPFPAAPPALRAQTGDQDRSPVQGQVGGYTAFGRHRGASLVPAQPPRVPDPLRRLPL